jgi:hypothetical protein
MPLIWSACSEIEPVLTTATSRESGIGWGQDDGSAAVSDERDEQTIGANLSGPAIGQLVLLADPHLVLAPHFYRGARRKLSADLRHAGEKVYGMALLSTGDTKCLRTNLIRRE